jgi:hypothetical protein
MLRKGVGSTPFFGVRTFLVGDLCKYLRKSSLSLLGRSPEPNSPKLFVIKKRITFCKFIYKS